MPDSSISTTYILKPNLRDAFWIGLFSFGASISISSTCVQRALNASLSLDFFSNSLSFLIPESVAYEFKGKGGVITYSYPEDKKPDTKVSRL